MTEIKKTVLDAVVERFPSVEAVLRNFYKQRMLSTTTEAVRAPSWSSAISPKKAPSVR